MASETQSANGWSNVFRAGDNGSPWTGILSALTNVDANYIDHSPWKDDATAPSIPHNKIATNSPTVRVTFPAFSLPLTDSIASMTLMIRHRQVATSVDGGNVVLVDAGGTVVNYTLTTVYVTTVVAITSFPSIATLNSGTYTVDLNYAGSNGPVPLPLTIGVPDIGVDQVRLNVMTLPSGGGGSYSIIGKKLDVVGMVGDHNGK